MKAAIFGYDIKSDSLKYVNGLVGKLKSLNISCLFHEDFKNLIKNESWFSSTNCETFTNSDNLKGRADIIISMGGDGTFLNSVKLVGDSEIPVIGINLGRLGFLANISKEKISEAIDAIHSKKYKIEKRALIELADYPQFEDKVALNEICVQKTGPEMIKIQVFLNDDYLNTYWADGLIVATPTGSTAYSLSVGGPIIVPGAKNFVLSPISPHTLTVRPVIIPDSFDLKLKVTSPSNSFLLNLDHHSYEMTNKDELILRRANFDLNLIKLEGMTFYKTLRDKLMWGVDKRN